MRKLRRHDWRCHRAIECTICMKMLDCRQEISSHREREHRMFKKVPCRFFPDCFDQDECLFEHNNVANESFLAVQMVKIAQISHVHSVSRNTDL